MTLKRIKGSFVLDVNVARAPLRFDNCRMFADRDGECFTIPMAGRIEISAE